MTLRDTLIIALIAVMCPVAAHAGIKVTETKVTYTLTEESGGVANDSYVVYSKNSIGNEDLYAIDNYGIETLIAGGPGNQFVPDIEGDSIVYLDDKSGFSRIYYYNLVTRDNYLMSPSLLNHYTPTISGNYLAYFKENTGSRDVFYMDRRNGIETRVTGTTRNEESLSFDESLIAWALLENGTTNVYACEIGGSPFPVAVGPAAHYHRPSVSGNRIAYIDGRTISIYDHSTGLTTRQVDDGIAKWSITLDGDKLYWTDNRNGNRDIFLHTLHDGQTYQLTSDPSDQKLTYAYDNRIIY
ncbi:MAG: hypothetical protein QGG42_04230 [Phycisphaerae bacterium]|jgi:beta propeller repeat protein|nr:hypothetical protein [Phycisphaerae bacterium]